MALKFIAEFMVGQTHIAVDAFGVPATSLAAKCRRISSAVLKKDSLLAPLQGRFEFVQKKRCKVALEFPLFHLVFHISDDDFGQFDPSETFGSRIKRFFAFPKMRISMA